MSRKDCVPEKVQEAVFNDLLSRPENQECADCDSKSPTWVSIDFGVYLCIRCSGVHRQLGPHITRVRSTKLDSWKKENIEIMAATGNKIANDYYEYKMPSGVRKPNSNTTMEQCRRFVDEKYIKKLFAPGGYPTPVQDYLENKDKPKKEGPSKNLGLIKEHSQPNPIQTKTDEKPSRKRSISLESPKNKHHHHSKSEAKPSNTNVDLLNDDFFGGSKTEQKHNDFDFGEFKSAEVQDSKPIDFGKFKPNGSQSQETKQQTQNSNSAFNFDFSNIQPKQQTTQNTQNSFNNFQTSQTVQNTQQTQQVQNTQQQTQQPQNDLMKLYSQSNVNNNKQSAWDQLNFNTQPTSNQSWGGMQQNNQQFKMNVNMNQGGYNMNNGGYNMNGGFNNQGGYQSNTNFNQNMGGYNNMSYNQGGYNNMNGNFNNGGFNQNTNMNGGYNQNSFGNQGFNQQTTGGMGGYGSQGQFNQNTNLNMNNGYNNYVSAPNKFF